MFLKQTRTFVGIAGSRDRTDSSRISSFDLLFRIPRLLLVTLSDLQHRPHLLLQHAASPLRNAPLLFIISDGQLAKYFS